MGTSAVVAVIGRRRTVVTAALLIVLAGAAATVLWRAAHSATPDRTGHLAAQLRCPACEGESVAESRSPLAQAMRAAIVEQVARGRSDQQIRAWFVHRYGPQVLAYRGMAGIGNLLWVLPALALGAAALLAWRALRKGRRGPPPVRRTGGRRIPARWAWDAVAAGLVAMVALVALTAQGASRGADPSPSGLSTDVFQARLDLAATLEKQGSYAAAADIYRDLDARAPDIGVRLKLAFALLRAGDAGQAGDVARQVLAAAPDEPDGLLLLGLSQRANGSAQAAGTLRRFLDVAPRHPAVPQVRRLLGDPH